MSEPACFDLRDRGYRVLNETQDYRPAHQRDDPWDLVVPGRSGFVAPWGYLPPRGSGLLVAATRSSVTTRRLLAAVPGARVVQDGSDGQNITFAPDYLDVVADVLGLKRKRVLSAAHRAKLAQVSQAYRYRGSNAHETALGRDAEASEGVCPVVDG
jgi:hypothetical protein